jgi:hypothetical protein
LRDLREVERQYSRDYEPGFTAQISRAREAFDRGDREQALAVWHKTRALFPELSMTSEGPLMLLLDLGAFDAADALMQTGWKRYPYDAHTVRITITLS